MFSKSDNVMPKRALTDKLGIMVWQIDSDAIEQIDMAKSMGFSYVRLNLYKTMEQLSLAPTDDLYQLDNAAIQRTLNNGLTPIVGLTFEVPTEQADDSTTHSVLTTAQINNYKLHWQWIVDRWKNNNVVWEAINEVDGGFFSNTDGAAAFNKDTVQSWVDIDKFLAKYCRDNDPTGTFSTLCSVGYPGVHHIDDNGKLSSTKSAVQLADSMGLFNSDADLISFHPYVDQTVNSGCPEILVRDGVAENNMPSDISQPLISTEFGYSRICESPEGESYKWQGLWDWNSAIELTIRSILIQDLIDYRIISMYAMGTGGNYNLYENGKLNPLGAAINNFIHFMSGRVLSSKISVVPNGNDFLDDVYCLLYTKKGFRDIVVYWTPVFGPYDFTINVNGNNHTFRANTCPQFAEV